MLYRTIDNSANVRLSKERRSASQLNTFPFEDLKENIVLKERRATLDKSDEGLEVTEAKISQAEFHKYFDKYKQSE